VAGAGLPRRSANARRRAGSLKTG